MDILLFKGEAKGLPQNISVQHSKQMVPATVTNFKLSHKLVICSVNNPK